MAQRKKEKPVSELDLALAVSDVIDIKEVIFTESHCKLFGISREPKGTNSFDVYASTEYSVTDDDKILLTMVRFKFKAKNSNNEDFVLLEAVYVVAYSLKTDKQFSDVHYKTFSDYCSVFHVWPYWREFVQRSLANFGLPPLTLQVYKFGSKLPKEELFIPKKISKQKKTGKLTEDVK
jgi:preprotein translocase subunit SecB